MFKVISILSGLLFVMVGFQNCSSSRSFEEGNLVAKNSPPTEGEMSKEGDLFSLDENIPEDIDEEQEGQREGTFGILNGPQDSQGQKDKDCDEDKKKQDQGDSDEDMNEMVICVLDGPGKSIRLGVQKGSDPTAATACMSKRACLDIAAEVFDVKEAHMRGTCPLGNPDVVEMKDSEVQRMCDKKKNAESENGVGDEKENSADEDSRIGTN